LLPVSVASFDFTWKLGEENVFQKSTGWKVFVAKGTNNLEVLLDRNGVPLIEVRKNRHERFCDLFAFGTEQLLMTIVTKLNTRVDSLSNLLDLFIWSPTDSWIVTGRGWNFYCERSSTKKVLFTVTGEMNTREFIIAPNENVALLWAAARVICDSCNASSHQHSYRMVSAPPILI